MCIYAPLSNASSIAGRWRSTLGQVPPSPDPASLRLVDAEPLPPGALLAWSSRRPAWSPCGLVIASRVLPGIVRAWARVVGRDAWAASVEYQDPDGPEGRTVHAWYLSGPGLAPARPIALGYHCPANDGCP